jgi:hypothetical protein
VVASRRLGNPVGWVFCSIGLSWGAYHFSSEDVTYALLAAKAAAWIASWLWVPGLGLIVSLYPASSNSTPTASSESRNFVFSGRPIRWSRLTADTILVSGRSGVYPLKGTGRIAGVPAPEVSGKKSTHSFPLPVYSAPGGLPQASGRAA